MRTERGIHWIHAGAFFVLLGSGLVLYLPSLSVVVSNRPLVKAIHVYTAIAWVIALVLVVLDDGLTLASVFLLTGHLYLTLIHRATRHSLRGMTRGSVREDWAARHHAKWLSPTEHQLSRRAAVGATETRSSAGVRPPSGRR